MAIWLTLLLSAPVAPETLRVVTFNLYNRPLQRTARLQSTTAMLRSLEPDLLALQEVSKVLVWRNDPSADLADALGLQRTRFWLEDGWWMDSGVALLSRYPMHDSAVYKFSKNKFWDQKGFVQSVVDTPFGKLGVINAHMSSTVGGPIKERQFAELQVAVQSLAKSMPVLLLGDFNEQPEAPTLAHFIKDLHAKSLYDVAPPQRKTWAGGYGRACDDAKAELLDHMFLIGDKAHFVRGEIVQPAAPYPSDHCPVVAEIGPLHWNYDDAEHWGALDTDYARCANGKQQSPVALSTRAVSEKAPELNISYAPFTLAMTHNGHTLQQTIPPGSNVQFGNTRYALVQFHFHHPSEHTLDGQSYPLEIHFVHRSESGELLVLAVLVSAGQSNPTLEALFAKLPQ